MDYTLRDFGYRRANNYVTLILDIITCKYTKRSSIHYLKGTNDDGFRKYFASGLVLDTTTGEIAGRAILYPNAVTTEYKFTGLAKKNRL